VEVGLADRVAALAVGFCEDLWVLHISICITPDTMSTFDQKGEGTQDDRGRDGGTNFILRVKEQETRLTLHERNDDDDDE
jgi:hypothetical protein